MPTLGACPSIPFRLQFRLPACGFEKFASQPPSRMLGEFSFASARNPKFRFESEYSDTLLALFLFSWCLMGVAPGAWAAPPSKASKPTPQTVQLPEAIREALHEAYSGWKIAPVSPEVQQEFVRRKITHSPCLTSGDYDRDGKQDYAVQIALTQAGQEEQIVIAYLQRDDGYHEIIIESRGIDPAIYLWTSKDRHALMVLGGPAGDSTYEFETDTFHEVQTTENPDLPDPSIPRPGLPQ